VIRTISGNNVNLIREREKITHCGKGKQIIQQIGETGKIDTLIHIYMTSHFPGLLQTF